MRRSGQYGFSISTPPWINSGPNCSGAPGSQEALELEELQEDESEEEQDELQLEENELEQELDELELKELEQLESELLQLEQLENELDEELKLTADELELELKLKDDELELSDEELEELEAVYSSSTDISYTAVIVEASPTTWTRKSLSWRAV